MENFIENVPVFEKCSFFSTWDSFAVLRVAAQFWQFNRDLDMVSKLKDNL